MARGRPKKNPAIIKDAQISIRVGAGLVAQLKAAAEKRDPPLSLSQEVVQRLKQSFEELPVGASFGSPNTFWFFQQIATVIAIGEHTVGKRWWEDRYIYLSAKAAILTALEFFEVKGPVTVPKQLRGTPANDPAHFGREMMLAKLWQLEMLAANPQSLMGNLDPSSQEVQSHLVGMMSKSAMPALSKASSRKSRRDK